MKTIQKTLSILFIASLTLLSCSDDDSNEINNSDEDNGNADDVICDDTPTEVVEVLNPDTGKTWMDRNLGASRAATSKTDEQAYGDLYQWGRGADGHQCRNSNTTTTLSSTDQPENGDFILSPDDDSTDTPVDWRSPQNDNLWQGVNGINNPCPTGFRLPTLAELNAELASWSSSDPDGAFASTLKLPLAGSRIGTTDYGGGVVIDEGSEGDYWSSTIKGSSFSAERLIIIESDLGEVTETIGSSRAYGYSIRCIRD